MQLSLPRIGGIKSTYPSLILLFIAIAVIIGGSRFALIDDAYISFRYAYQLEHTGALVYNPGERVEGITNLLWTLLLSGINLFFNLSLEQAALIASLVLLILTCICLWQLGPMLGTNYAVGTIAAILLLSNSDFLNSATNGLEVPLFTILLIEILYSYLSGRLVWSYIFAGLLFMTRPEGLFFGLLILGLVYLRFRSLRKVWTGIAVFGGIVAAVTLYRAVMYGSLLPNSVIAKSFPINLLPGLLPAILTYFSGFVKSNAYFVVLAIGAFLALSRTRAVNTKSFEVSLYCLCGILFSVVVMVRNGGDWMGNHRLLVQYGVLYAILLITLVGNNVMSIILAIAFITLPFLQTVNLLIYHRMQFPSYQQNSNVYADVTARLATVVNKTDVISAEAIGYISYKLIDNNFIDPLGLTNA